MAGGSGCAELEFRCCSHSQLGTESRKYSLEQVQLVRNRTPGAGKKPRTPAQQIRSSWQRRAGAQSFTLSKLHNPKNTWLITSQKRVLELSAYAASPCWSFVVAKCVLLRLKRLRLSSTFQALHTETPCTPPPPKPQLRHSEVCY